MKKILILLVIFNISCSDENSLKCGSKTETIFPYMENITLSREIKKENYSKFDIKVDSLYLDKETGLQVSNLDFTGIGKNIKIGFKGDSLIIYRDNNRSSIAVFDGNKDSFIYPPYLVELDSVYYDKTCNDSIFKFKYSF